MRVWAYKRDEDDYAPYYRVFKPLDDEGSRKMVCACVFEDDAKMITDALNAAEARETTLDGYRWGDGGPFCPYCGNLRGQHHRLCQVRTIKLSAATEYVKGAFVRQQERDSKWRNANPDTEHRR